MDSQKRNLLILIALLGVWGLFLTLRPPWSPPAKPEVRTAPATPPRMPMAQGGGLPRLKKELLDLPRPAYPPEVPNFFGSPPPPPPSPVQVAVAPPAAPPAPPPPDPFQEEAKRLRYVGYLQAGEKAMAFVTQGSQVYTVEVGSTISERFRVQAITEDAVVLSSVAGDKQARLPLTPEGPAPKR
jgi:hypothetical protein